MVSLFEVNIASLMLGAFVLRHEINYGLLHESSCVSASIYAHKDCMTNVLLVRVTVTRPFSALHRLFELDLRTIVRESDKRFGVGRKYAIDQILILKLL